ncbi:MAG: MerR family transcriptional regulator [Candidatus Binatia bacterium]
MEVQLLGHLPDHILTWTGTAAALADECNRLMPGCGLAAEAGSANERLVRHYVQIGVLTPPEREGREAIFGVQQIAEFLAARRLLSEGWPLAKIGELLKNVVLVEDTAVPAEMFSAAPSDAAPSDAAPSDFAASNAAPGDAAPTDATTTTTTTTTTTPAERALQRIRGRRASRDPRATRAAAPTSTHPAIPLASSPSFMVAEAPTEHDVSDAPRMTNSLGIATRIAERRGELRDSLLTLGNASGTTQRQRIVRISLTPWCHVDIEARRLARLSETDPDVLGNALANALREERIRKGDSK